MHLVSDRRADLIEYGLPLLRHRCATVDVVAIVQIEEPSAMKATTIGFDLAVHTIRSNPAAGWFLGSDGQSQSIGTSTLSAFAVFMLPL